MYGGGKDEVEEPLLDDKKSLAEDDNDIIESTGFGGFQVLMLVFSALCWITCAISYESISWQILFLGNQLKGVSAWGLVATPFGVLLASPVYGVMSDNHGRSFVISLSCVITMIVYTGSFNQLPEGFIVFRFLLGVAITGLEAIPSVLVLETCPRSSRGQIRPLLHVFWHFGSVAVIFIGSQVSEGPATYNYFNKMVGITVLTICAILLPWFVWTESPILLLSKGDRKGAQAMLQKMAWLNRKQIDIADLDREIDLHSDSEFNFWSWIKSLSNEKSTTVQVSIILCCIFFCQTSAYLLWMTSMVQYLKSLDMVDATPEIFSAAPTGRLLGACVAVILPKYLSMEAAICGGAIGAGVSGFLTFASNDFMFWTSIGYWFTLEIVFCCVYTYAPMAYPAELRTCAVTFLMAIGDIGDIILTFVGQSLTDFSVAVPLAMSYGLMIPISICAFLLWKNKDTYRTTDSIVVGGGH